MEILSNYHSKTSTATPSDTVSIDLIVTVGISAAIVGVWAIACLIGAFINSGLVETFKGLFFSISG